MNCVYYLHRYQLAISCILSYALMFSFKLWWQKCEIHIKLMSVVLDWLLLSY